jgi:hypothetical protein
MIFTYPMLGVTILIETPRMMLIRRLVPDGMGQCCCSQYVCMYLVTVHSRTYLQIVRIIPCISSCSFPDNLTSYILNSIHSLHMIQWLKNLENECYGSTLFSGAFRIRIWSGLNCVSGRTQLCHRSRIRIQEGSNGLKTKRNPLRKMLWLEELSVLNGDPGTSLLLHLLFYR